MDRLPWSLHVIMTTSIFLAAAFVAIIAALIAAATVIRRRQTGLLHQREALQKQRGAAHIREIALAAQAHTGRSDIAVVLLQLSSELLEQALQLAPLEPSIGDSLQNLHQLMDSMHLDDRPAAPVPNPESLVELTQASMQLTEAARLLVRLEARGELDRIELRAMQDELRRIQRSLDFRTRMRRDLEAPSTLIAAASLELEHQQSAQARLSPSH